MSTIKDVAALAGVAPSTVSNVFTKKKYVSPKVTRKVREACEQLNYTPSFLASGMRTQKTSLIGLMLSSAAGGFQEFYHYFIEGATIAAAECGYSVILYYEVTDKEKLRAIFASGRGPIEGAVLLTPRMGDFRFIEMETNNIPYVLVGREFLGGGATFVDVCNDTITYEIASRLIGEGRRNFVFLNSAEELYISQDRLKGFNRALREAGIPVSRARVESVLAADAAAAAARLITEKTDAAVTVSATAAQQEEGTQTVTVSYGGMSATFTITVEAQADPGTEGEENGTKDPDGGLPAGAIAGIVIACVVVVAGAVTAVVLIRKKKGGKQ